MDSHKLGMGIFFIVGAVALVSFVMLYQDSAGFAVYEQPSNNKPPFLLQSSYMDNFNLCKQYYCSYPGVTTYGGEYAPATPVGIDAYTGNLRCGCPDGREFQARPDRIEVDNY